MTRDRQSVLLNDVLVAVILGVLALLAAKINRSVLPELETALQSKDVLLVVLTGAVAFRRRYPLTVLCLTTAAFLLVVSFDVPEGTISSIALFLALFSAGAYSRRDRLRDVVRGASVAASMGSLLWFLLTSNDHIPGGVVLFQVFSLLLNTAFFTVGWIMGDLWRKRAEDREELTRRAETVERQRHQLAEQAVAEERLRIARELHDVVAHHVSLMGVQAGAARRVLHRDPENAAELLQRIESAGREAVDEMGRLVGFLRSSEEESVAPLPTLDQLDDLIGQMRNAGLQVELHRVGRKRPLDPSVDLSAYRVVQEALTNALKHGSESRATVEVSSLVDHLSIRVRNPATGSNGLGSGRGLMGMRERVALSGGEVEAGHRGGWFEVEATFPYRETPS